MMRLAIDGLGLVGPFGEDGAALLEAGDGAGLPLQADVSPLAHFYGKRALRRVARFCRLGLLGAARAMEDCRLPDIPAERTGLILATGHGPVETTFDFLDSVHQFGPKLASPTAFSTSIHNVAASTISIMTGLTGPCLSVNQFGMSLASALLTAGCWLAEGRIERALVGAVDEYHPLLAEVAVRPGCPLATGDGALFMVLSKDGPGRYGLIGEVAMSAAPQGPVDPSLPFELPAGQAFALAAALLRGAWGQPVTATDPCWGYSAITLQRGEG